MLFKTALLTACSLSGLASAIKVNVTIPGTQGPPGLLHMFDHAKAVIDSYFNYTAAFENASHVAYRVSEDPVWLPKQEVQDNIDKILLLWNVFEDLSSDKDSAVDDAGTKLKEGLQIDELADAASDAEWSLFQTQLSKIHEALLASKAQDEATA